MQLFRVLALTITALVVSTPSVSHAGGRLGMGRGHSFRGPSGLISMFPMSPKGHRRFDRSLGMGRGHSFHEPSDSISTFPMSPRGHPRFDRSPFAGMAVIPWYPFESAPYVVVREVRRPHPCAGRVRLRGEAL